MKRFLPKRVLAGLVVASLAFAVAFGAAASLGLTVDTLSADQAAITACDSAVASSYTTSYSATAGGYVVDTVTLSGISAACDGYDFAVTLGDNSSASLAEVVQAGASLSGVDPNMTLDLSFLADDVLASDVELIAVSITQ